MKYHIITDEAVVIKETFPGSGRFLLKVAYQGISERCATCRMCGDRNGEKVITALLSKEIDKSKITPGTKVIVELRVPVIYIHLIVTFLLPLIGFFCGVWAGYAIFGTEGTRSLATAVFGFFGASLSYLLGKLAFGKKISQREDPVIVNIQSEK